MPFFLAADLADIIQDPNDVNQAYSDMINAMPHVEAAQKLGLIARFATLADDVSILAVQVLNDQFTSTTVETDGVIPSAADSTLLGTLTFALNGVHSADAAAIKLKYTAADWAIIFPIALIYPNKLAYLKGEDVRDIPIEALNEMTRFDNLADIDSALQYWRNSGVAACDIGSMREELIGGDTPAWASFGKLRVAAPNDSWATRLSAITMCTITALNLENTGGNYVWAARIAMATSLGLVNVGNDGFNREWTVTKNAPNVQDVRSSMAYFMGPNAAKWANVLRDLIAFVGYVRVSFTHIYSTADTAATARLISLAGRMVAGILDGVNLTVENEVGQSIALYSSAHAYSMGGACGYSMWWSLRAEASPYLGVRHEVYGDSAKPVIIMNAGLISLTAVPMLGAISELASVIECKDIIKKYKEKIGVRYERSSSLSMMLCGLPTITLDEKENKSLRAMACIVAAAVYADFLPRSLGESYYITHVSAELPGIVETWKLVFKKVTDSTDELNLTEVVALITSGAR